MAKVTMNLQDSFLNQVRKDGSEVVVILADGTTINGHVKGFDNFTVILHHDNKQSLIYKHAIAQLVSDKMPLRVEPPASSRSGGMRRNDMRDNRSSGNRSNPSAPGDPKKPFNQMDLSNLSVDK
ncbi:RNA chaperone Hfq [Candidatus Sumerlaeota bacterium]|nr:RNA chaperone Hfq [Candidatus Sumerlaeota bacterium]